MGRSCSVTLLPSFPVFFLSRFSRFIPFQKKNQKVFLRRLIFFCRETHFVVRNAIESNRKPSAPLSCLCGSFPISVYRWLSAAICLLPYIIPSRRPTIAFFFRFRPGKKCQAREKFDCFFGSPPPRVLNFRLRDGHVARLLLFSIFFFSVGEKRESARSVFLIPSF